MKTERIIPKDKTALIILILTTLFFAIVMWRSIAQTFMLGFQRAGVMKSEWVGLDNYRRLLLEDDIFRKALMNSFIYVLMIVPATTVVGLTMALLLNEVKNLTLRGAFSAPAFLSNVVPIVAVAIVWRFMYQPSSLGLFNSVLGLFGIGPLLWLRSPDTAKLSITIMGVWKGAGFTMLIYLAALQAIPQELYEAAMVDGANAWQRLRSITLPLLMSTTLFLIVMGTIGTFGIFSEIYVMTTGEGGEGAVGGPAYSTISVVLYLFNHAFRYFHYGYASAIAVVMFLILVTIAVLQFKFLPKGYEE
ncbi:MAG: sugar ABC transporter permease [Chloroflexota bacterium]